MSSVFDLLKFIIFDFFFLLLFYFKFSKYKPTQIPKQTKTDRLRCVPEKTINSSKHILHRTPQDRVPKAGVDESLQIWGRKGEWGTSFPSSYLIFKHQHEDSANTQVDALKQNLGDVFVLCPCLSYCGWLCSCNTY